MKSAPAVRLMMTTDTVGGVWFFSTQLARALSASGYEVLLVSLGRRPTYAQRDLLRGCRGLSLLETDLELEWQDPAGADIGRARAQLGETAREFKPDLVHLNGLREGAFDWQVPSVVVAHSCVNSWASACSEEKSFAGEAWRVYSANVRAGLHGADAWVAPTLAFRDRVARQYKPPTAGSAIWNGVGEGDWGTPPKQPTILAAGRLWDKAKNLPALSSLGSEIEWPIRIAGPLGPDSSKAGASSDGCAFLGEIPHHDLLREMAAASVYVSPALYEPFGLAVLEAAHAGCALLLSDIPSFRELWDGAAVFFDPHDRPALRRCLRSLCDDELRRRSLQRAATVRARRYPLRNTVDRYRSLYESLLPTHPRVVEPVNRAEILA